MLTRTTETSEHFKINWDWRTASFSSWPYTQRQPSSSCTKFFVKTSEEEDFSFFVVTFHMGIWWPHHSCREMHQSLENVGKYYCSSCILLGIILKFWCGTLICALFHEWNICQSNIWILNQNFSVECVLLLKRKQDIYLEFFYTM